MTMNRARGFTLVELILVITLAGLVAAMIASVLSRPLEGFVDQSRRAELTDLAASALDRMARDIRLAVPNSLSVSATHTQVSFLPIEGAGRYRANRPDPSGPWQDPPVCLRAFNPCTIPILWPSDASGTDTYWLVVYNIAASERDQAVISPSVISPKAFRLSGSVLQGNLPQDFRFKYASPQHRLYWAKETLGYECRDGKLLRSVSPNLDGSNASESVMADSVSACSFTYDPGSNTRSGLVSLRLSLIRDGETITLLQQVHVDNAP